MGASADVTLPKVPLDFAQYLKRYLCASVHTGEWNSRESCHDVRGHRVLVALTVRHSCQRKIYIGLCAMNASALFPQSCLNHRSNSDLTKVYCVLLRSFRKKEKTHSHRIAKL